MSERHNNARDESQGTAKPDHDNHGCNVEYQHTITTEDGCVTISFSANAKGKEVGTCLASYIPAHDKSRSFWLRMEPVSDEAASLASSLFTQFGYLRKKLYEHPVAKGTGVWGAELNANSGQLLVIDKLNVDVNWRRKHIATELVSNAITGLRKSSQEGFAFAQPGHVTGEAGTLEENLEISEEFWRSQGFRRVGNTSWFAFAAQSTHPSHGLMAANDLRLEKIQDLALHKAAINFRVQVVKSILEKDLELASARNSAGYTPLQALEDRMEMLRYVYGGPVFSGFPQECLSCLEMLRRDKFVELPAHLDVAFLSAVEPKDDAVNKTLRAKFGCSCGQCIAGFLSPRMAYALGDRAPQKLETYRDAMISTAQIVRDYSRAGKCLPDSVLRELLFDNLTTRGFWKFCDLIGDVCYDSGGDEKLPTIRNVMARFEEIKAEESPDEVEEILEHGCLHAIEQDDRTGTVELAGMVEYLKHGGTVKAAASVIFRAAEDAPGIRFERLEDDPGWAWECPRCTNDCDIDLVWEMCGYEG